jgi:transcriptional regulator with XRE-family HTH domain
MAVSAEHLRFILGLKLKTLRQQQDRSLQDVAAAAGLSVSYLSEIEKGKKYPKPDKLLRLAQTLGVPFDELVSLKVHEALDPLKSAFSSTFMQEFPFELYGLETGDLFSLVTGSPEKTAALVRTFLEIRQMYDVQVEHFLFAALRSYQQMHGNYFEELEDAASLFREARGWPADRPIGEARLRAYLEQTYGYVIDLDTLPSHPDLKGFRSVYVDGSPPRLLVNGRLMASQRAFILGREIAYRHLGLIERAVTSSWLKVESFDQVLNNFKASYFSGALLIDREALRRDMEACFSLPRWDSAALLACIARYEATPEMFLYRLTELVGALFGLHEIYFMRFNNRAGTSAYHLTKLLNMSRVPVPHGIGLGEHYCRRWPAMKLLRTLAEQQQGGLSTPIVRAQRSRFLNEDAEFFVISMARPLALTEGAHSSVSIGFRLTDAFRTRVRFWDDPDVPRLDVNLTCERCGLAPEACHDRVAPPTIQQQQQAQQRKEEALQELMHALSTP